MSKTLLGNFDDPSEVRSIPKGKVEVLNLEDMPVMRATFEPGWKWSADMKPVVGTDSCEVAHFGYMLAGKMHIKMDDGTEYTLVAGDAANIKPGHDAWVEGTENCVFLDFQGAANYAKPKEAKTTA